MKKDGAVVILDTDNTVAKNIEAFIKRLQKNKLYTKSTYSHVNAEFIGKKSYNSIIKESRVRTQAEKGFDPDAYVKNARRAYARAKKRQQKKLS